MKTFFRDSTGLFRGMSFKQLGHAPALMVGLFIVANIPDVRSEVRPTAVPEYDGVVRQTTGEKGFPFDLRRTIDWGHSDNCVMKEKAEGYLAEYGKLRMDHLVQFKEIGTVEPIVVLEAYGNSGLHAVYMLAGKTLYRVSWQFMFRYLQGEKNAIKVCPVDDTFIKAVQEGVLSLKKDFKGWEDCGIGASTGGMVFLSYKIDGLYRTTVCNSIDPMGDVPGFERYRNLFTLIEGKLNAAP